MACKTCDVKMCQLILLLFYISKHSLTLTSTGNLKASFHMMKPLGSIISGMHGAVVVGNYNKIAV